jgi:predicted RNA-binding protein with PIN domain
MSSESTFAISEEAALWLLERLDPQTVFSVLTGPNFVPSFVFKGFKVSPKSVSQPTVRQRIAKALHRHGDLAEAVLFCPGAPWLGWHRVISVLEEWWLVESWCALARRPECGLIVVVAMAMDEREPVAVRGRRALRKRGLWSGAVFRETEPPPAWAALCDVVGARSEDARQEETVPLERRIAQLTRQIEELQQRLRIGKGHIREAEDKVRQHEEQLQEREKELRQQVRDKQGEVEELCSALDRRVAEGIAAFKRTVLGLDEQYEDLLTVDRSDDLIEEVDDVLAEQQRLNDLHGTREQIRKQIRDLEDARTRLGSSIEESVTVLPAVYRVETRLGQRIQELRDLLGDYVEDARMPDIADQLRARVKAAHLSGTGETTLDEVERLLEQALIGDMLGEELTDDIRRLVTERRDLIRSMSAPSLTDAALHLPGPEDDDGPGEPREIWRIGDALKPLAADARPRLFVDGYNVIRRLPELASVERTEGLAAARDRFCALCRARARGFSHVEVVFDGAGTLSEREESGGITVVYSPAAQESQNADNTIVARLEATVDERNPAWLVTDDYGLRRRAKWLCEAYIPTAEFYRFLKQ